MEITSKENPVYKELRTLSKSSNSQFLIEGKKLFCEAINSKLTVLKIFIDKKNKEAFLELFPKYKNHELIFMSNDLISSLFTTVSKPTSKDLIVSVAKRPDWKLSDILKKGNNMILLEKIQDPSNLGLVLRSALAFSACGVILLDGTVDPFNTKVIRASAGAVFHIPTVRIADLKEIQSFIKQEKYKIIGTSSKAGKKLTELNFKSNHLFLFGNEGSGLSRKLIDYADEVVSIPHSQDAESLNLGIAVSIVLWEAYSR